MSNSIPARSLDNFATFGELLHFLRRRAGITQTELAIAVGYSVAQISRLEQNLRPPDPHTISARFVPALGLQDEEAASTRLLDLSAKGRRGSPGQTKMADASSAAKSRPTIVVLPFLNMSADPENEYFCDGLAGELIGALGHTDRVFVVARTSAFSFKGKSMDVREIGRQLNATHALEGSAARAGDRLRVTVQLINVEDGYELWSERFDRNMTDIFAIQDEITLAVVDKLKVNLLGHEKVALQSRPQENLAAYQLYLRGKHYLAQRPQGARKATECFEQAIALEPNYALAHAGLADCYNTLGSWENGTLPGRDAFSKGKAEAARALELDGSLAEAYTALGYGATHYEWDWPAAELHFQHAFELNPNYPARHHWYSHYLTAMERTEESLAESEKYLELDPLDLISNIHLAWYYHFSHEYEAAVEQTTRTAELYPGYFWTYFFFGLSYEQQGRLGESEQEFELAVRTAGDVTFPMAGLGHLYAVGGRKAEAKLIIASLRELSKKRYVPAYDIAIIYAGLERRDETFDWLEKAFGEGSSWLPYLNVDPRLDNLRADPRFADLLKRVHLAR